MTIADEKLRNYPFLDEMSRDTYFPAHLVDKGKAILVRLCETIESTKPTPTRKS